MKTLSFRKAELASAGTQVSWLNDLKIPEFNTKLKNHGLYPLRPTHIDTLQVNVGKLCNQVCKHCHVDAGPERQELMSKDLFDACLSAIKKGGLSKVDITGGAPEMNPYFRYFVESCSQLGVECMVRCNLTILVHSRAYEDLPDFFKKHKVHVISSLPYYEKKRTDAQRGLGVFEKSIVALQKLNAVGYAQPDSELKLDLVYNPVGAFLPTQQKQLETDFKRKLFDDYGIKFNQLFAITNLPVSRYLEYLIDSGNLNDYMEKLVSSFNAAAASQVMCRNILSVGFDGTLYDCDFNQMLEIPVDAEGSGDIRQIDFATLSKRVIRTNKHCFGCTAGEGSSCGGQTT